MWATAHTDAGAAAPPVLEGRVPTGTAPLVRPADDDGAEADRWRLLHGGIEVAVGQTALTDPAGLGTVLAQDPDRDAVLALFERGVAPFALLRVDLAAPAEVCTQSTPVGLPAPSTPDGLIRVHRPG